MKKIKGYEGEDGSMVSRDYGGSSGTGEYAPAPTAKKQRIVTKEQLAKSGMSLRDFLNKERGLTRRGESAAPMPPPVPAEVTQTSAPAPASAPVDETKMSLAERAKNSRERARSGSGTTDTRSVGERLRSALGAGKDRGGNTVDFEGSGVGMKSGGKVSSASSRADGIAQRGKTRGKMC